MTHVEDEGFAKLHPLQQAFVLYGAVQCGFCIPGQIMTAYALLKRNPDPSEGEIRQALKDTLCRCAGYPTIVRAIQAAAEAAAHRASRSRRRISSQSTPIEPVIGKLPGPPGCGGEGHRRGHVTPMICSSRACCTPAPSAPVCRTPSCARIDVSKARALPGVVAC